MGDVVGLNCDFFNLYISMYELWKPKQDLYTLYITFMLAITIWIALHVYSKIASYKYQAEVSSH